MLRYTENKTRRVTRAVPPLPAPGSALVCSASGLQPSEEAARIPVRIPVARTGFR
jgi:hypothetical protein